MCEPTECVLASNKYGIYAVPIASRHRPAAKRIIAGQIYEQNTIEFLVSNMKEHSIVHAGTYFGDFLPALSKAAAPGRFIFAFEPNPESFRCAAWTRKLNAADNVRLTHAGLSAETTTLPLIIADPHGRGLGGASHFSDKHNRQEGAANDTTMVAVVRLDDVIPAEEQIGIIQLDVEGHEQHALEGARKIIERWRPLLVLESVPSSDWLSSNLSPWGYKIQRQVGRNFVLAA